MLWATNVSRNCEWYSYFSGNHSLGFFEIKLFSVEKRKRIDELCQRPTRFLKTSTSWTIFWDLEENVIVLAFWKFLKFSIYLKLEEDDCLWTFFLSKRYTNELCVTNSCNWFFHCLLYIFYFWLSKMGNSRHGLKLFIHNQNLYKSTHALH